jgi:hypothetical protein
MYLANNQLFEIGALTFYFILSFILSYHLDLRDKTINPPIKIVT